MKKFYITTPIYYINDIPHIGHTSATVAADIVARMHRQKEEEVFFLTGTDEHGQKVAESAEKENLSPQEYCDKVAPKFEQAWRNLNISFDYFIRTTDPKHKKVVAEILDKIYKKGDIYKGKYEGKYCIGCEKFLTESDLKDGHCPLHPAEQTVEGSEENWFFRLSKYVPRLIKLIENDETNYIFPQGKKKEILAKLKAGVKDISFTREKVEWGIPAPWDKNQTIYVWVDALINYYSATQFVDEGKGFWPAAVHLLGKEIIWFHTVIWQAMLLSAGMELPERTYVHSFYMIDGQKMSKSRGNVISPGQLVKKFGVDGARYLVATSFPCRNDADVGMSRFAEKYNADLANNWGNLVARLTKMGEGLEVKQAKFKFDKEFEKLIDSFSLGEAVALVFKKWIDEANALLNKTEPWKLATDDEKRKKILTQVAEMVMKTAYHLKIIMPKSSGIVLKSFDGKVGLLDKPLFPRIK